MANCPKCHGSYPDDVATCPVDGADLAPGDPELAPGAMVGEYRIERKLGEGGFGAVFEVVHPVIGKTAALKVLSREFCSNPEMVSRFVSEARAVNQIRHKGIVDIFALGVLPSGRQYLVMELLDGVSFDRYLHQLGPLAPQAALPLLSSMARALDAAHAAGIVHRDLKPENVFLVFEDDGTVRTKLLDFGIAKQVGEGAAAQGAHRTRTGIPLGTPLFMSPEQCRGVPVDRRSDVYSLGVMTFEALTGRLPFEAPVVMDLMLQHLSSQPPLPSQVRPELGEAFDGPVLHMLAKAPEGRPDTAGLAVEELYAAAASAGLVIPTGELRLPRPERLHAQGVVTPGSPADLNALAVTARTPRQPLGSRPLGVEPTLTPNHSRPVAPAPRLALKTLVLGGLLLVAAGAAAAVLVVRAARPPVDPVPAASPTNPAPVEPVAAAPTPTPVAAAAPTPMPAPTDAGPRSVQVTVQSAARGATVFLGSERLAGANEPFSLPAGASPVTLTLNAPGFAPATVVVVPSEDRTVAVALKPLAGRPSKLNRDLESPFVTP